MHQLIGVISFLTVFLLILSLHFLWEDPETAGKEKAVDSPVAESRIRIASAFHGRTHGRRF